MANNGLLPVSGPNAAVKAQSALDESTIQFLTRKGRTIRRMIVEMIYRAQSGHPGGSLGAADLVVALYYHLMRHDPHNPTWPERDRFILSKGHCAPVIYAVLAECGYFPVTDLLTFRRPGSHLQGHPYQPKTPGIEASTGTLGLGISTGLGMALAAKIRKERQYYYILCGDGEVQEGQVWEAAMFANKYCLDNVIAFVDRNCLQTDGWTEDVMPLDPLPAKWHSFGWNTMEIDGHSFVEIVSAVETAKLTRGRPTMIVARTIKGKGVSFMENVPAWHGMAPNSQQYKAALEELTLEL